MLFMRNQISFADADVQFEVLKWISILKSISLKLWLLFCLFWWRKTALIFGHNFGTLLIIASQQTFVGLEDVFNTCLEDVFNTSSAKQSCVFQDVLKTSCKASWRRLGGRKIVTLKNFLKTSWRHVLKKSWRHVLQTSWRHVLETSWRHVLEMSWRHVLKTS